MDRNNPDFSAKAFTQRQADIARARIRHFTGKVYPKLESELSNLTVEALMELVRLVGDAEGEVTRAKRQSLRQPWRQ